MSYLVSHEIVGAVALTMHLLGFITAHGTCIWCGNDDIAEIAAQPCEGFLVYFKVGFFHAFQSGVFQVADK